MTILPREERLDNCIEWLTDLLESNFQKAKGRLARGGSRCCLGVGVQIVHGDLQEGLPDTEEAHAFGLSDRDPYIDSAFLADGHNDGRTASKKSHPEIGRMILQRPHAILSKDIVEDVINYFTFGEY